MERTDIHKCLQRITWTIAIALVLGLVAPGQARAQNQSDTSGTNSGDLPAPQFPSGPSGEPGAPPDDFSGLPLLSTIVNTSDTPGNVGETISQALNSYYAQCVAASNRASTAPRRFTRRTDAAPACPTPVECNRLSQLIQETRTWMQRRTNTGAQPLSIETDVRLW